MIGALLINVGTPDSPEIPDVRRYLREFLMDPRVIDIPYPFRWMLVNGAILRSRPAASSALYRKIWAPAGSPLMSHSLALGELVQAELGAGWRVGVAMRYGNPSVAAVVRRLKAEGVTRWVALPMYPQYSLAATKSAEDSLERLFPDLAGVTMLGDFHAHAGFLEAFAERIRETLAGYDADHLLFSFHGLPERQVKKTDPTGAHCLADASCCDRMTSANRLCYRAQSFETARRLAALLGWPRERWSVGFQSRLGRTPWILPHSDALYSELAKKGVRRLAVASPSFVADCLETLEEIAIRGREQFVADGGEDLRLVPSLNGSPSWARTVAAMLQAAS